MSDELEIIERRMNQYRDQACGLAIAWFVLFVISALMLMTLRLSDVFNLIGLVFIFFTSIFALCLTVYRVLDYAEAAAERAVYLFTKGQSSIQEEDWNDPEIVALPDFHAGAGSCRPDDS